MRLTVAIAGRRWSSAGRRVSLVPRLLVERTPSVQRALLNSISARAARSHRDAGPTETRFRRQPVAMRATERGTVAAKLSALLAVDHRDKIVMSKEPAAPE